MQRVFNCHTSKVSVDSCCCCIAYFIIVIITRPVLAVEASSDSLHFTEIGLSFTTRFVHLINPMYGSTLWYRVAAVVEQSKEYGSVNHTGLWAYCSVYIGESPIWTGLTPENNSKLVARADFPISMPLQAFVPEVERTGIQFKVLGTYPPVISWLPAAPIVNLSANVATQHLSINYVADLAGSEYLLRIVGEDNFGFRTPVRFFYVLLPRPEPSLILPQNNSFYTTRIGCDLSISLTAEDRTSAGLDPRVAMMNGFVTGIALVEVNTISRYGSKFSTGMPSGASLVVQNNGSLQILNPTTSIFHWRPVKGQEGLLHR